MLHGVYLYIPSLMLFIAFVTVITVPVCVTATFRSEGAAAVTSSDIRTISSFDWHPSSTSRMLVISHSGQVADVYLRERIAMVSISCGWHLSDMRRESDESPLFTEARLCMVGQSYGTCSTWPLRWWCFLTLAANFNDMMVGYLLKHLISCCFMMDYCI